jgi:diguanylate cyclase (GGDEF)-like protein
LEDGAGRRLLPFAGATLVAVASLPLEPQYDRAGWLLLAVALVAVSVVTTLWLPWSRLPVICQSWPAFATFGLVAVLRHAGGGSDSGLGLVVLVPVTWLALYGTRRQVLLALAATAGVFLGPLLLTDSPSYTWHDWRKSVVVTAIAALVALVVTRNRIELEARRRAAEALADALAVSEANLAAISAESRRLRVDSDVRPSVVESAVRLTDASLVVLLEPDGGFLVETASHGGVAGTPLERSLDAGDSACVLAMATGDSVFLADTEADARFDPAYATAAGVRSALMQPLLRAGDPVAVLVTGWAEPVREDDPRVLAARAYSLEAAVALERADDLHELRQHATEDPLTGAANRRELDRVLATVLPLPPGTPHLAVLMLDLDRFKDFNDTHGHAAGDVLLKESVAAWRGQLRDGDVLARYGGEEFCVVLRSCPPAVVDLVAERVRASTPGGRTVSIGSACALPGETPGDLLLRADRALYRAKSAGRNTVVRAEDQPEAADLVVLPSRSG